MIGTHTGTVIYHDKNLSAPHDFTSLTFANNETIILDNQ